jgi:hypothetical protein
MAESSSNDNIFANLKTLLWGAFIGVVSFQILAPLIWDYLHNSLGINYSAAYWLFTLVYFLILPSIFLIWIAWNIKSIKTCLPPFNEKEELSKLSKLFIKGLMLFIVAQSTCTVLFFFIHVPREFITLVMILYVLASTVLLFFCFSYALGCIHNYVCDSSNENDGKHLFLQGFISFFQYLFRSKKRDINKPEASAETKDNYETKRKQQEKFYRSFIPFAIPAILMLILLYTVGFGYLRTWEESKK